MYACAHAHWTAMCRLIRKEICLRTNKSILLFGNIDSESCVALAIASVNRHPG